MRWVMIERSGPHRRLGRGVGIGSAPVLVKKSIAPAPLKDIALSRNWLRVFRSAEAARLGPGVGQQRHTRAVRSKKWWDSVAAYGVGMHMIATFFGPYAPYVLPSHGSVFSHYFKRFDRFVKLATSSIIGVIHAHEQCHRCACPFCCGVCCVPWVVRLGDGVGSRYVAPWAIEVGLLCGQVE